MVCVKVWCLPNDLSEKQLQALYQQIFLTAIDVKGAGVKDRESILILFPADRMNYGLGEEIRIEISGLSGTSRETKKFFGQQIGETVKKRFPFAFVESAIENFDPRKVIKWTSIK